MATQWVQHISGTGEKWEVRSECVGYWIVERGNIGIDTLLTKLDYALCEPPDIWEEVTHKMYATNNWPSELYSKSNAVGDDKHNCIWVPTEHSSGYRIRKIAFYTVDSPTVAKEAFIVEKKKKVSE